ncbi:Actin cortical patch component [Trichophyton interdigitale]|uniref:Actin cortical patch component n=1 Tax=Trichophyton interdigitale TaxID=101480 RepID=A0A9P4YKV5_9EURO|nr:Actin cortical patch component [Trichophyton interdigitale]KAF3898487.1 Actin cortical patch component [Trichophyton interdigitale]KAG8210518.1 Actin cortical patch component [Trichophyton interdigitale]
MPQTCTPNNRPCRHNLRQATYIVPSTGQRVHGTPNLSAGHDGDDEHTPLLQGSPRAEAEDDGPERAGWMRQATVMAGRLRSFMQSETGKGILKCSLTYLLGSMATFVPVLYRFLGDQSGKHTVATVTVYFHPARTKGSMMEAFILAFIAFCYAAFISITSMSVSVIFQDGLHMLPLGHVIILIVFCGGGLGFIGWVKQRRGDPLVNVACSLASLAIITVMTKEGSVQRGDLSFAKIIQVFKMVVMGVLATMTVCFVVFPISAKKKLRQNMVDMTDSLSDMLEIITESFIYGASGLESSLEQRPFLDASCKNKAAYSKMEKLLKEAKFEHFVAGTEAEYRLERKLVRCIQDISQSIGGLRSAAALQFDILNQFQQPQQDITTFDTLRFLHNGSPLRLLDRQFTSIRSDGLQSPPSAATTIRSPERSQTADTPTEFVQAPADMFERFITHLGPSMNSLAYTLKEILGELPYGPAPDYKVTVNNKFRTSLERALDLYRHARNDALNIIYSQKDLILAKGKPLGVEADLEEVAASCGHFSFSLLEFGEQLKEFLTILDQLQLEADERPNGRTWRWIMPWTSDREQDENIGSLDSGDPLEDKNKKDKASDAPFTKTTFRYKFWKALHVFRRDDTKFAIKVGAGAALYALPSFMPETRPIYSAWRGEWGLVSYMLVCSMTIGASNTTGYARFLGTCIGAICALASWYVAKANVIFLALFGWVMSFCTAYITIARGNGPMGRFIMLTYNLVVLYAYALAKEGADDGVGEGGEDPVITDITLHRVVAVFVGILWGIIITRIIWPSSAKRKLKDGLSVLWLRLSVIWKRDPLSTMIQGEPTSPYFDAQERIKLQLFLNHLDSLLVSARSEFSLKRPFPDAEYKVLVSGSRRLLDAFQAMNLEIMKNLTASEGEAAMLRYTLRERMQLSARISHLLSVMASSMKLGYALNEVLPDTEHARDRLLARLHHFRNDKQASRLTTDEDYALLYAYALVTAQLSKEIVVLMQGVRKLFGVIDEDAITLQ